MKRRIVQVEGDVVVPVETASGKHEFAARTLRPKLNRLWDPFIEDLKARPVKARGKGLGLKGEIDVSDPEHGAGGHDPRRGSAGEALRRREGEARKRLKAFLKGGFEGYGAGRNKPEAPPPRT